MEFNKNLEEVKKNLINNLEKNLQIKQLEVNNSEVNNLEVNNSEVNNLEVSNSEVSNLEVNNSEVNFDEQIYKCAPPIIRMNAFNRSK